MSVPTKVIIGLLVILALLLLGGGVTRAGAVTPVEEGTPTEVAFTLQATPVASRGGAHCFEFTANQPLISVVGKLQASPAMEAMWCSGRYYRKVTDLVYLHCFNKGGFYSYDGCSRDPGKVGYSYLGASGHWHYHWIVNGLVFDKTPDLTIRYYANGQVSGVWYWHTT